jgi:hypothetical protein
VADTCVYIDGFNMYYGCIKDTPYKWLDLEAMARRLLPQDNVVAVRYFTARVKPRPSDLDAPARQAQYLRALKTLPLVSVHFGHFLSHVTRMPLASPVPGNARTVEVIKTEEKGSDVNLAAYMLLDGFQGRYRTAVVLSNDSDLCEPVRMVTQELNLQVGVINPHPPQKQSQVLSQHATFFKQLRPATLVACQLPPTLTDARGTFSKPPTW